MFAANFNANFPLTRDVSSIAAYSIMFNIRNDDHNKRKCSMKIAFAVSRGIRNAKATADSSIATYSASEWISEDSIISILLILFSIDAQGQH